MGKTYRYGEGSTQKFRKKFKRFSDFAPRTFYQKLNKKKYSQKPLAQKRRTTYK